MYAFYEESTSGAERNQYSCHNYHVNSRFKIVDGFGGAFFQWEDITYSNQSYINRLVYPESIGRYWLVTENTVLMPDVEELRQPLVELQHRL